GVTNLAFRILARRYGAGLAVSEMVDADGMFYDIHRRKKEFATNAQDAPVTCQLFGARADTLAQAAKKVVDMGADIVDLNMGCPSFKLSRKNAGAKLLTQPELVRVLVRSVVSAVEVPVTVKIRSGWDCVNAVEIARVVEDAGADGITVHGRTAKMMYSGAADWGVIKRVKEEVGIPVIGNGDVVSAMRAKEMLDETGCDFVMIGRAALGNPFIFEDCVEFIEKGTAMVEHTKEERQRVLLELWEVCKEVGDARLSELRMHACWFSKGLTGGRRFREEVGTKKTIAELEELVLENFC
ncbi:MAG: tRNA dihydrouridine synthase DusB, partial [Candidatus Aenigmarchaeota archaeon]|nr:tRNA dihydrouridine synthase DusB [Candidatus Aenigmarchaeota archaeon]